MAAAANQGGGGGRAASSASSSDEVIDVVSHAPAAMHQSRSRSSTSSNSSRRGGNGLRGASTSENDDGGGSGENDGDLEDDDDDDDTEQEEQYAQEHAYRRGRHTVPMHSPGEDLTDIDLLADDHLSITRNMPRLPRLRNRVFFQSDEGVSVVTSGTVGGGGGGQTGRRVFFRRRKRQEGDVFWTAIFVSNVLSLAVLSCLVVYLTQTDFFASHQNELFGTTVDNRFTVVSQQNSHAKIYLKSGYSNSRYSEAMIAFGDGVLQLGRRALASTDAQKFYGLSLSHNGTAAFTNKLTAPAIMTDYLRARKAVVFEDGTVMTTAANLTGGVKEIGDLNLVSKSGSVVTSAGGKPILIVDPLGTVAFPNANAEESNAQGIVVDGTAGKLSIGGSFHVESNANTSTITTSHALQLNASRVVFGATSADKVTLTVSRPSKDPSTASEDEDDTSDNDGDETETDDANRRTQTRATSEANDLQKRTTMEIVGQSSSSQDVGGDVWISGGDGLENGGSVVLAGGIALGLDDNVRFGSVGVNAQLDPTASSLTEIGSQGPKHVVHIQGDVLFNGNKTLANSTSNGTQVTVAGSGFNVQAKKISINNTAVSASSVTIDSTDLRIGTMASVVKIGGADHSKVTIQAKTAQLDATESIALGGQARNISIGSASRSEQSIDLVSGSIRLSSSGTAASRMLESAGSSAVVTNSTVSDIELTDGSVSVHAKRLDVGARGETKSVSLSAFEIEIGRQSLNSSVNVQGEAFSVASGSIELGAEESTTTISGETITIDASDRLIIGEEADHIAIGSKDAEDVSILATAITLTGATSITGSKLLVDTVDVAVGGKATEQVAIGDQATKKTVVAGQNVEIGAASAAVSIGASSPEVSVGSPTGVINLRGKVTLNGNAFESRRRLSEADSWFGYLNAPDRFVIEAAGLSKSADFSLPLSDRFASLDSAVQFEANAFQIRGSDSDATSGHVKLSLSLDGLRLQMSSAQDGVPASSKLRCRVYRQKGDSSPSSVAVLEAASVVEYCSGSECDSEVFLGVSSERIVRFSGGDRFNVRCSLSSSTPAGTLVVDSAQLSFVKL